MLTTAEKIRDHIIERWCAGSTLKNLTGWAFNLLRFHLLCFIVHTFASLFMLELLRLFHACATIVGACDADFSQCWALPLLLSFYAFLFYYSFHLLSCHYCSQYIHLSIVGKKYTDRPYICGNEIVTICLASWLSVPVLTRHTLFKNHGGCAKIRYFLFLRYQKCRPITDARVFYGYTHVFFRTRVHACAGKDMHEPREIRPSSSPNYHGPWHRPKKSPNTPLNFTWSVPVHPSYSRCMSCYNPGEASWLARHFTISRSRVRRVMQHRMF
jgi:hypothetical protein